MKKLEKTAEDINREWSGKADELQVKLEEQSTQIKDSQQLLQEQAQKIRGMEDEMGRLNKDIEEKAQSVEQLSAKWDNSEGKCKSLSAALEEA